MRILVLLLCSFSCLAAQPSLLWKRAVGGQIAHWQAQGPDGSIYLLAQDQALHSIDPRTGEDRWLYRPGGDLMNFLAVSPDGTIYIQNDDFYVFAVNPEGEARWRCSMGSAGAMLPMITPQGILVLLLEQGTMAAISRGGEVLWTVEIPGKASSSPVLDQNQTIHLSLEGGGIFSYNLDGELLGQRASPEMVELLVDPEGNLLGIGTQARMILWDALGERLWDSGTEPGAYSGAFYFQDQWHMLLQDGLIYRVNQQGAQGYYQGPPSTHHPILTDQGRLIILDNHQKLWMVDLQNQEQLSMDLPCDMALPLLGRHGRLYLGGEDWKFYAYNLERPAQGWSQYRGSPQRSASPVSVQSLEERRDRFEESDNIGFFRYVLNHPDEGIQEDLIARLDQIDNWSELAETYPYWDVMMLSLAEQGVRQWIIHQGRIQSSDPQVRASAYAMLGKWELHSSRRAIISNIQSEEDPFVLAHAYLALGNIGADWDGASCQAISRSIAGSSILDERQIMAAAEAYLMLLRWGGEEQSRRAILALVDLLERAPSTEIRQNLDELLEERFFSE